MWWWCFAILQKKYVQVVKLDHFDHFPKDRGWKVTIRFPDSFQKQIEANFSEDFVRSGAWGHDVATAVPGAWGRDQQEIGTGWRCPICQSFAIENLRQVLYVGYFLRALIKKISELERMPPQTSLWGGVTWCHYNLAREVDTDLCLHLNGPSRSTGNHQINQINDPSTHWIKPAFIVKWP